MKVPGFFSHYVEKQVRALYTESLASKWDSFERDFAFFESLGIYDLITDIETRLSARLIPLRNVINTEINKDKLLEEMNSFNNLQKDYFTNVKGFYQGLKFFNSLKNEKDLPSKLMSLRSNFERELDRLKLLYQTYKDLSFKFKDDLNKQAVGKHSVNNEYFTIKNVDGTSERYVPLESKETKELQGKVDAALELYIEKSPKVLKKLAKIGKNLIQQCLKYPDLNKKIIQEIAERESIILDQHKRAESISHSSYNRAKSFINRAPVKRETLTKSASVSNLNSDKKILESKAEKQPSTEDEQVDSTFRPT